MKGTRDDALRRSLTKRRKSTVNDSNDSKTDIFSGGFSYRPGGADRPPPRPSWLCTGIPHESRHVHPYGLPERNLVLFLIQIDNANGVSAGQVYVQLCFP